MDELKRYSERLWAADSLLRAGVLPCYGIAQLFGIRYFLKEWDCKNFAFDPDKLRDLGVVVGNRN